MIESINYWLLTNQWNQNLQFKIHELGDYGMVSTTLLEEERS